MHHLHTQKRVEREEKERPPLGKIAHNVQYMELILVSVSCPHSDVKPWRAATVTVLYKAASGELIQVGKSSPRIEKIASKNQEGCL